jgi:hypothetical protein
VFALNAEVSNAIRGMGEMSTAEGTLGGAISGTNPAIDEQAGKLRALWAAAAGSQGLARSGASLQALAEQITELGYAEFQASDEAKKLGSGLDFAGKIALAAADNVDEFNAAMRRLKAQDAQRGAVDGLKQSAISTATANAQRAINAGANPQQVANDLALVTGRIEAMEGPVNANTKSMFLFGEELGHVDDGLESNADGLEASNEAAKKFAEEGLQRVKEQFDDIKGKAASVIGEAQKLPSFKAHQLFNAEELKARGLTGDSAVSVDDAINGSASRPDAINENARRLMDVAANGISGQEWLEEFKREVPEVFKELEQSSDVKGTAFRMLQEFEAGLRPELLDRGMIKDRVKAMIIGDQNAAALAQEIAQEIATEMGISLQQAMAATNTALGTGTGEGAGGSNVAAPDMTPQGTLAGESLRAGMVAGFNASGLTVEIVAKIDQEFGNPKSIDTLKKSGGIVGAWWGKGFVAGASDNVAPGVYEFFAAGLLPFVVAALGAQSTRTGANP